MAAQAHSAASLVVLALLSAVAALSTSSRHRYQVGDPVPLSVNKVWPFDNPSESYQYFDLPFCSPPAQLKWKASLGEALNGDRLFASSYNIQFRVSRDRETLCKIALDSDRVKMFRQAIAKDFCFQMLLDDLPFWGFVGRIEDLSFVSPRGGSDDTIKYYLFTHLDFHVLYNGDTVIEVGAFSDPSYAVDLTDSVSVDINFTYSVDWKETSKRFEDRMEKYSTAALVSSRQRIHWLSLLNAIGVTVLCLCLLGMLYMNIRKNNLIMIGGEDGAPEDKEVGWKYIHGDVFRCPKNLPLLSAVLGMGTQLLTMAFSLFILAFLGILHPYSRGRLFTALVFSYSLTSIIGGYTATSFYCQFAATGWEWTLFLTGILYSGPFFVIFMSLNTISVYHGVTAAVTFSTFMLLLTLYIFLTLPLLALGGVIGCCSRSVFQSPSAVKPLPREIPSLAWYRRTPGQMLLGGFVPFSVVIAELHYLIATLWGYKIYTLPSILFLTFIFFILLTAILSVGMTYLRLSGEDHEWWWRSMISGASPAIFMYCYCIYYFATSSISGFLQITFFLGYNACLCYAVLLMLAAISFRVSFFFVCKTYSSVKSE